MRRSMWRPKTSLVRRANVIDCIRENDLKADACMRPTPMLRASRHMRKKPESSALISMEERDGLAESEPVCLRLQVDKG